MDYNYPDRTTQTTPEVPQSGKVLSIVSLVLGIASIFLWYINLFFLFPIGAIVLSRIAGREFEDSDCPKYRAMYITGRALGIIALATYILLIILVILGFFNIIFEFFDQLTHSTGD